jgi:glycosyltransferase involved in cell wall biosynthesis
VAWVGTVEPRKNQEAILPILQELWDAGLSFRFVFAGNRGRLGGDFAHRADALVRRGYPLVWIQGATEAQVHQLYRNASFTVYLSLVEGYGLPVLESLAEGTPCLTSSETSMAEIAESAGGCLLVDPTDRAAIKDGLGRLLRDEALLEALRRSIDLRRIPTWAEYKRQVSDLVTGNAYAEPRSQDSFLRNYQ